MSRKRMAFRLAWAAAPFTAFRAYDPRLQRTRLPGPYRVQIQTIDRCNGGCVMCPYAGGEGPARLMDDDLYARIVTQLASAGTVRLMSPMLQNEPLLDRRLAERVATARTILGRRPRIMLVTNGSLMTSDRAAALAGAGLNAVAVSLDAVSPETYAAIRPGLDFDRVTDNVSSLLRRQNGIDVEVRFLLQQGNRAELPAFRRLWESRGARVTVQEVTNRADTLSGYGELHATRARRFRDIVRGFLRRYGGRFYPACHQPFVALAVLVDGRAVVCCHDWGPREVVGDLSRESLEDVWNGSEMNRIRQLLWERHFERSPACAGCSVVQGLRRRGRGADGPVPPAERPQMLT